MLEKLTNAYEISLCNELTKLDEDLGDPGDAHNWRVTLMKLNIVPVNTLISWADASFLEKEETPYKYSLGFAQIKFCPEELILQIESKPAWMLYILRLVMALENRIGVNDISSLNIHLNNQKMKTTELSASEIDAFSNGGWLHTTTSNISHYVFVCNPSILLSNSLEIKCFLPNPGDELCEFFENQVFHVTSNDKFSETVYRP